MSDLIKNPQIFNSRDCLALSSKVFKKKMN